jgi:hypothetical protein
VTSPRPRARRIVALATGLTVAGLALAGCSVTNPIQSEKPYSASDGVRATIGDVRAVNLLVITAAHGAPGILTGGLVNDGADDQTVTITVGGADPATLHLSGHQTLILGPDESLDQAEVSIAAVDTRPGGTTTTVIKTGAGSTQLEVPVLDGSLPEYATLVPTHSPTPTAEPTPTATATPTATGEPSPSPSPSR